MDVKNLIPWRSERSAPSHPADEPSPFLALHRQMNRLFDDFFRDFDAPITFSGGRTGWSTGWPNLDITEDEKQVKISAELPGLDEKDIEVTLVDGVLTLQGEKKGETKDAVYSERWHGKFSRSLRLGSDVDPDKVTARFGKGVLTVTLEKRPEAQSGKKRIPIGTDSPSLPSGIL